MKLSKAEEELMNYLWEAKKAYMKDLIAAYSTPKPATTTIATMLKRMTKPLDNPLKTNPQNDAGIH